MKNLPKLHIDERTPILIYGAASNGMRGYASLHIENKYNVVGFIDKRASEIISQYGLPVWSPNDSIEIQKTNCLVCICIKNVFDHESIVSDLIEKGFSYFIFKPINNLNTNCSEDFLTINRNYEYIFGDKNDTPHYALEDIPALSSISVYEFSDHGIVQCNDDTVITSMAFDNIFFDASDWRSGLTDSKGIANVAALVPQISLFSVFNGSGGDIDLYLNHCASTISNSQNRYGTGGGKILDTPAWRRNILSNRRAVFDRMNDSLELDWSFFLNNAPNCYLDNQNRIIMKSAKHRAAFFIVKKRKYIPIKISKGEYEYLLKRSEAESLQKYLLDHRINCTTVPINHPFFYGFPCSMPNFYEIFVYPSIFEIAKKLGGHSDISKITVCDALGDSGAVARYLQKVGFDTVTVIQKNEQVFVHLLDSLAGVSPLKYVDDISQMGANILFINQALFPDYKISSKYDMVFLLTNKNTMPNLIGYEFQKQIFKTVWNEEIVSGTVYLKTEF